MILNLRFKIDPVTFKTVKKVLSTLWWIALILLALTMFNIIGAKMQGRVPQIFGYSVINIITGSMGDTIPEGSYILVEAVDPDEIEKDDIICFYSSDPAIYGIPNTHRVIEEPVRTEGGIEFVTKGDANGVADKYTAKGENLIGRYVKTMDGLNTFVSLLDKGGMTVLIFLLEGVIMAMAVGNFLRARKQAVAEAAEGEKTGEPTLSKEEFERILGENPDLVKEIEAKLGLSSPPESNEESGEQPDK